MNSKLQWFLCLLNIPFVWLHGIKQYFLYKIKSKVKKGTQIIGKKYN